jgi:hypothetical protein
MELTVNGNIIRRQFPFTISNMNLFADLSSNAFGCGGGTVANGFRPLAVNADGSINSCTNPAKYASTVSFFMHGAGGTGSSPPKELLKMQAFAGLCSATVTNAVLINEFVYKVDLSLPPAPLPCAQGYSPFSAGGEFTVTFLYNGEPVGPRVIPVPNGGPIITFEPGEPMPMIVWVTQ